MTPIIRARIANYYSLRRQIEAFQEIHRGSFSLLIRETLEELRDYARAITHRSTGTLAESHTVYFDTAHQRGEIRPDPTFARRQGRRGRLQSVEQYAAYEHARGGDHAFYQRTLDEYGDKVVRRGVVAYMGRMPRGVHQ